MQIDIITIGDVTSIVTIRGEILIMIVWEMFYDVINAMVKIILLVIVSQKTSYSACSRMFRR